MKETENWEPDERHKAWVKAVVYLIQQRIQPTTDLVIKRMKEDKTLEHDFIILDAEEVAKRKEKKRGRPKKEKKKIISVFDIEKWKRFPYILEWYQKNLQLGLWGQHAFEVKTFLRGALFRAIEAGDVHALTYVMKNAGVSIFEDESADKETWERKLWELGMSGNINALLKYGEMKNWISSEDGEMKKQFEEAVSGLIQHSKKGGDENILSMIVEGNETN